MKNEFENNLEELEKIVNELEKGNVPLDSAIEKYTKAMECAKICNEKLNDATEKVNKIINENGEVVPFNLEESEE